jgi:hypothetical protein
VIFDVIFVLSYFLIAFGGRKMALSTGEKITAWGIIVAIIIGISAFFVPEVRQFFGLENSNKVPEKPKTPVPTPEKTSTPSPDNFNSQNFNALQPASTEQIVYSSFVITRFDVAVTQDSTVVSVFFKLKDENQSSEVLSSPPRDAYIADPDGKVYNVKSLSPNHLIRQHEVYAEKLVFERLDSKPPFLYFHYERYNIPLIILKLNWLN